MPPMTDPLDKEVDVAETRVWKDEVARDRAWARYYARHGAAQLIDKKFLPDNCMNNKERERIWRWKYSAL